MRTIAAIEADAERLIQVVDAALAEAVRKAGSLVVCRPGCHECCKGPVEISALDALRLSRALAELGRRDAGRAAALVARAARLDTMGDDDLCPALDPATCTCELYPARPLMCRVFGPATRWGGPDVGICELCFSGTGDQEISACAVDIDPDGLEEALSRQLCEAHPQAAATTIADCLRASV